MRFAPFPWRRSLATQLLCTYTAALLLTISTTVGIMWFSSRQDASVALQQQLHKVTGLIREKLEFNTTGALRNHTSLQTEWSWVFRDFTSDVKYRVLDPSGRAILSSNADGSALAPVAQSLDSTMESVSSDGEALVVRTERMTHGTQTYYIQVGVTKRLSAFVRSLTTSIRISDTLRLALASVVLVTIAVYFTLRRVLKPLRETSTAASQIDARHLSRRLSTHKLPTEFLPVVTAFNLTLDRLEKGYSVQRAFLADAAHELKTPLSLIRAQIDMDGTADRQALLQDIDRMARQVNQLLHLAEASETQNYVFEPVDVAALAEDVCDYLQRLAERHGVYVDIRHDPQAPPVEADRGALFMLLKNIVENAIQHSPAGGVVTVRVTADDLSVCDDGPGIGAEDLPQLFKRFWRGPTRRNDGTGLGLSICSEIAAAHNWRITAQNTGGGAEFTLFFVALTYA
jgi:two-component system, OmpR family, sensor histidine kinase QseC